MKNLILLLVCVLALFGCTKDIVSTKNYCNAVDPLLELPWLKKIVDDQECNKYSKMTIYKCEYQQQKGFVVDSCVGCPDSLVTFFDCDGNKICETGGKHGKNTCPDFISEATIKEIVFRDTIVESRPATYFCEVDNPLEDIPWLKERVDAMISNNIKAYVYRCIYNNQPGFLINDCVSCRDGIAFFASCDGILVCRFGGFTGEVSCPDFNEKLTLKELIFEIK